MAKAKPKTNRKPQGIDEQLRAAIEASGLTLNALAVGAEVAYPVVFHFARGQRDIRLETAARLCKFLRLELTAKKRSRR